MSSGSTLNYSFPYPFSTDPVNVSGDIEELAVKIDVDLKEIIEDTAAAQWNGGSFTNGILQPTYDDNTGKLSVSLVQNLTASGSPTFVSPDFTGVPISTTASVDTNTTQIATTAFVIGQASSTNPTMDGVVAIGTSLRFARADHIHPTDTSRAPINNPIFTGLVSSQGTEILMSSSASGSPTENIFFSVERGTEPNVAIRWNEIEQAWQFTNDGSNYIGIGSGGGGDAGLQDILMFAGM